MQVAGSSKALPLQQLLTAPITRMFTRLLWTRQHLSGSGIDLSCQLFDRLQSASGPMKLPVQVYVVVQPADWDPPHYVLSRDPKQQLPVTHSSSNFPEAVETPTAHWEEVPAAALPTAAAGPGSNAKGPFLSCVSRSKAGKLKLVKIKHNGQLDSYRTISGSPGAHDIVLFEQVGG
jgi:hypothetical protein